LETTLTAWPGEFNKQNLSLNLRRAATSKRDMAFPSKSPLGADEPWILLYDGKNNPAGNPYQSSCAVLRNPNETKKAEINITNNYSVSVTLERAEGLAETHYIFWSFPGEDHFKALERMRNLKIEFVPPVK
jgi:hypothetical protein